MILTRVWTFFLSLLLLVSANSYAIDIEELGPISQPIEPMVGSWTFSGMVTNESGERYGYFFQMQRQGSAFHAKTALIDGETNKLLMFYEGDEKIDNPSSLNWHVGRSFIRFNPINDSWIFGIKAENHKGFNFKVDMLKKANDDNERIELRPGVDLQAIQTSSLNGHIQTGVVDKEEFVTGNNAWFGKLWFSKDQKTDHEISTTFCRLGNENGFYSANMKEPDATRAAVAGWRDAAGNRVKMSQFVAIKPLDNNDCRLSIGLPKLNLDLANTLWTENTSQLSMAGFSKQDPKGFCFVSQQSFLKLDA